jgi:hypothetical protein
LNIASSLSDAKNKFKQIACIIVIIIIMMYKAQCHYYLEVGWWEHHAASWLIRTER